jgi:hypothetical protein
MDKSLVNEEAHGLVISKAEHLIIKQAILNYLRTGSPDDLSLLLNLIELHLAKEERLHALESKELRLLHERNKELFVKGSIDKQLMAMMIREFMRHDDELNEEIKAKDCGVDMEIEKAMKTLLMNA